MERQCGQGGGAATAAFWDCCSLTFELPAGCAGACLRLSTPVAVTGLGDPDVQTAKSLASPGLLVGEGSGILAGLDGEGIKG